MPLTIERTSPTTLVVTRHFAAPLQKVWDAHMKPELLRRWCVGPDGWSMPVCENDARPGGALRYEWTSDETGQGFHVTGTYEVVEPPKDGHARIIHVERMHLPNPTPENRVTTIFETDGEGTRMIMTMEVESAEDMEAMIATGMTDGMESSYRKLDALETAEA